MTHPFHQPNFDNNQQQRQQPHRSHEVTVYRPQPLPLVTPATTNLDRKFDGPELNVAKIYLELVLK